MWMHATCVYISTEDRRAAIIGDYELFHMGGGN